MKKRKMMLLFLLICVIVGVLVYLILTRKINTDRYMIKRQPDVGFSTLTLQDFEGSFEIRPLAEVVTQTGFLPIYHSFNLSDGKFDFKVVRNEVVLVDRETNESFTLGAIVEQSVNEYGVTLYKIKIKREHQGAYQEARGFFPYYEKGTFTMMSSGGLKYSHEIKTIITSSKGEQLVLYFSNGYISTGEKSRITGG